MTDQEVELIRRHAETMACIVGVLLRNQLYAGIVDVTEYGVRGKRGDFDALISEDPLLPRAAVLSGRLQSTTGALAISVETRSRWAPGSPSFSGPQRSVKIGHPSQTG